MPVLRFPLKRYRLAPFLALLRPSQMMAAGWFLLVATCGTYILSPRFLPRVSPVALTEGEIATETVLSPVRAQVMDLEQTLSRREQAAAAVPPQYRAIPDIDTLPETLDSFVFPAIDSARKDDKVAAEKKPQRLRKRLGLDFKDSTLHTLIEMPWDSLQRLIEEARRLAFAHQEGIIRQGTSDEADLESEVEEEVVKSSVTHEYKPVLLDILKTCIRPTHIEDVEATQRARDQAANRAQPVYRWLYRDEPIIEKGQVVTKQDIVELEEVGLLREPWERTLARGVLFAVLLLGLLLYLGQFLPEKYADRRVGILATIALLSLLVVVKLLLRVEEIEISAGAMLAAGFLSLLCGVLIDLNFALVLVTVFALLVGLTANNELRVGLNALLSGAIGLYSVAGAGRRLETTTRSLVMLAVGNVALLLLGTQVFGLFLAEPQPRQLFNYLAAGASSGILAALLGHATIQVLERFVNFVTPMRLRELTDPSQPLMNRLIMEAPGTYHSSTYVANLAQSAAEAIGADGLLVRAGAMYHDVGKVKRPTMFVENQMGGANPHSRLKPTLSARAIIAHVKDGIRVAQEYRLPPRIIDFIAEHHGTCILEPFYKQALEEAAPGDDIRPENFRYPGPKPQSKETAILMLADGVEAAVRSLHNPSPGSISGMVERIVASRLEDGQLEDCDLTFKDLTAIKEALVRSLHGLFHARIQYESTKDLDTEPHPAAPSRQQSAGSQ